MLTAAQLIPSRPVLRYHGGKWLLAEWIISHFPSHSIYTEAFCGAASVLMQKPRSDSEVINDLSGDIVNLFRVLRSGDANELIRQVALTPFAYDEYQIARETCIDPVERARRMVVASYMSVGTDATTRIGGSGFRNYSKTEMMGKIPAHQWENVPANLTAVVDRLAGVIIENRHARHVLLQHDTLNTLHYVDPPYPHSTRGQSRGHYQHEMSDLEHGELAATLKELNGMVILSGYQCDLYDHLYREWHSAEKATLADSARPRTEVLWMNDAVRDRLESEIEQGSLFTQPNSTRDIELPEQETFTELK